MAQHSGARSASPAGARLADAFIIFAVTVVTMAFGAWLLLQLGLRLWSGMALALGIYAMLLTLHLSLRRAMAPKTQEDAEEEFDPWAHERTGAHAPSLEIPQTAEAFTYRPSGGPSLGRDRPVSLSTPLPPPVPAPAATLARSAEQSALPPSLPLAPQGAPTTSSPPPLPAAAAHAAKQTPPAPPVTAAASNGPPEMSVEMIQDLIKKLADELGPTQTPPKVRGKLVPQPDTESMVSKSISALEAAASSMRAASGQAAKKAEPREGAAAPKAAPQAAQAAGAPAAATSAASKEPPLNPQLVRVAEALAAERMEVLLEPIQALSEGRTKHFEITTRLLTADGATLGHDEMVRIAQGSGLMPRIDIARIVRAARVARRLGEGGRVGSVLLAVGGESLTDHRFLSTASHEQDAGNTMRLVVSFQQSEVRMFSPGHMQTLAALSAAGFRFALDGVTDLDMDFSELKSIGFEFVKLDAPVFLEGLPAPGGVVPANDITRMLSDNGLTLVVGRIDDDWQLARVLGFGVLFGRGALFGGARLVKPEVVAAPTAVA